MAMSMRGNKPHILVADVSMYRFLHSRFFANYIRHVAFVSSA
ncbi:hypothetical protein FOCG_11195 [Fusarium oxysporum f. sp. radicis-lycopersici 26381]|uniref:Uncharacterized protein n=1 Tax=Fusarium oxysporum Fo47 TaxID=660027 RepID=W9L151_FUSOX|nr:hypothetical protein FOZG_03011 [Fusarium oxysporum Fo47]EWZ82194.1 hypothetical protein FOWG_13900 [Fusarium oxysporum f. sp. lycopersici MN25]EXL46874.1 hypothetical protein FOCG_11195 [Fusarium oxysporum f. sp. radicis-lycopersici 26381]